jgi:transposase InsO family protein
MLQGKTGMSSKAYPIFSRITGGKKVITMIHSLRRFDKDEVAQERMKIIKFYERYGEKATKEAFGADRKIISRWRKRLNDSGGKLTSLVPYSTRPYTFRQPQTKAEIVEFIKGKREKHYRIGKEKLKVFIDKYCEEEGVASISVSTIGNIIKRNNFFYQRKGRIYHNPASKCAQRNNKKTKRLRVRYAPKPNDFGYIVSDSVERITDGIRDYFLSAIDVKMKFSLTLPYKRLTGANMKDFYQRFKDVYPGEILAWQSDNGSENLGEFDKQLKEDGIPHFFIYPRCPKIDTHIERYNRTLQEEFVDPNLDTIHDKGVFHKRLNEYLIYYNTERPHHSLGLKTPLQYFIQEGGMSHKWLTYTNY